MATETSKRLFTVDEYYRMAAAGILRRNDRVELIRGEILAMSPIGPAHSASVLSANTIIAPIVGNRALVSVQSPVRLSDYDELEPDIALLRPRSDFYRSAHAGAADVLLIIEIADSSLDHDRTVKADLYAESGIAEYWVADIPEGCVWAYSNSDGKRYRDVVRLDRWEEVVPRLLADCAIPVAALLP
jgi:Uma2 family endonuclease